jgi:hydrogenase expression/formation protein HypE
VSGSIGNHGVAILSCRNDLGFECEIQSDTASLNALVEVMLNVTPNIRCMRDPTRGGLVTSLNELAQQSKLGMVIAEDQIPMEASVKTACEFLGLDPLYVANEGVLIAICPSEMTERLLAAMQRHPLGYNARCIGHCIEDPKHFVQLKTQLGGSRIADWLNAEQLPRIC